MRTYKPAGFAMAAAASRLTCARLLLTGLLWAGLLLVGLLWAMPAGAGPEATRPSSDPQGYPQAQPQSGRGPDRLASATGVQNLSPQDRRFIEVALRSGIAEVREAALAERQASSPDVRRAAEHLQQDHSLANTELQRIATTHGLVAPKEASDDRNAQYSRLRSLSGATFDKEFLRSQIRGHTQSIQLFQRAQAQSTNRTVKTFAATTLPRLKHHLAMLRSAQDKGSSALQQRRGGDSPVAPVSPAVSPAVSPMVDSAVHPDE